MEIFNVLSNNIFSGLANMAELIGFSLLILANLNIRKLLKEKVSLNADKSIIYNTFSFDPKYTGAEKIVPAENKGRIIVADNKIKEGRKIIEQIKNNTDKIFLVNKTVFDWCVKEGIHNVAAFDLEKTLYGTLPNGDQGAISQGGLVFGDGSKS